MKRTRIVPRVFSILVLVIAGTFAAYKWAAAQTANQASWDLLGGTSSRSSAAQQQAVAESTRQLETITATMSGTYGNAIGLVVTDLSNGATASSNADTPFVAASIYKLYVAYGIYRKIDAGSITYAQKLTTYGTTKTVEQCLNAMITVSDNTCGIALGKLVGWAELDTLLASEGYQNTVLNNYDAGGTIIKDKLTSASDVALLLTRLYGGTLLGKDSTEHFFALLKADAIDYMLPAGLPDGTVVAHKVGYLGEYQHDAGIIYGAKKDVMVVMLTKGWTSSPETHATAAFTTLGKAVWGYISAG